MSFEIPVCYKNHPMKHLWEDDIGKHPDTIYEFDFLGYKCKIKRSTEIYYRGTVFLPEGHPCYDKYELPINYIHKVFRDNKIVDDKLYVVRDGKLIIKRDIESNLEGPGSFSFSTDGIGDIVPGNLKSDYSKSHYWTFEDVENFLRDLVCYFNSVKISKETGQEKFVKLLGKVRFSITNVKNRMEKENNAKLLHELIENLESCLEF